MPKGQLVTLIYQKLKEKTILTFTTALIFMKRSTLFLSTLLFLPLYVYSQLENDLILQPIAQFEEIATDIIPLDDGRIYVTLQSGLIKIIDQNTEINATPLLDFTHRIRENSEGGLLSLALHPNFENNGYFYIFYTDNNQEDNIARFTITDFENNVVDLNSEKHILKIDGGVAIHHGGCLKFGPDGLLYISIGDHGAFSTNPSQDNNSLWGKILRIDIDNGDPYSIPDNNPLKGQSQFREEIIANGLRNPWKFDIDSTTGDLWIGDVGSDLFEEVNLLSPNTAEVVNFGWRCFEATDALFSPDCNKISNMHTLPIAHYAHEFKSCKGSITGGVLWRDVPNTSNASIYIFADFCREGLYYIDNMNSYVINQVDVYNPELEEIVAISQDKTGSIFISAGAPLSRIYKLDVGCTFPNIDIHLPSCPTIPDGCIAFDLPEQNTITSIKLYDFNNQLIEENDYCKIKKGTYTLIIDNIDSRCSRELNIEVESFKPEISTTEASCDIAEDGIIEVNLPDSLPEYFNFFIENINGKHLDKEQYDRAPAGDYNLIISTDSLGCTDTIPFRVRHDQILFRPDFLNGTLSVPDTFAQYQWYMVDINSSTFADSIVIPGATDYQYTPLETAWYFINVKQQNGCSNRSFAKDVIITSLEEPEHWDNISIYPNPTKNFLNIRFNSKLNSKLELRIRSLNGREIFKKQIYVKSGKFDYQVDLKSYDSGYYIISINNEESSIALPFIKE